MRTGISIEVTATDRHRLEAIVADRNTPQKHVWRACIVLMTAAGAGTNTIMREAGVSKTAVWRWQERFMAEGVDGLLRDKTRPPGRAPVPADHVAEVVRLTQREPPHEATHWTARAMAAACGLAVSTVQEIWKKHGLAPHRWRIFKLSSDPAFVPKLRDVVGLYVDPPAHAIVLSVDERARSRRSTAPSRAATEGGAPSYPDPRLRPLRHDDAVPCPQRPRRHRDRAQHAASPPPGVHQVPQCHRGGGPGRQGRPRYPRQPRRP